MSTKRTIKPDNQKLVDDTEKLPLTSDHKSVYAKSEATVESALYQITSPQAHNDPVGHQRAALALCKLTTFAGVCSTNYLAQAHFVDFGTIDFGDVYL